MLLLVGNFYGDVSFNPIIKDDERSQVANLPRQLVVRKTVIEPYEVQATQIKKAKKGGGATRLKDKLSLIKQKLAEDENILTEIKSGKLQWFILFVIFSMINFNRYSQNFAKC